MLRSMNISALFNLHTTKKTQNNAKKVNVNNMHASYIILNRRKFRPDANPNNVNDWGWGLNRVTLSGKNTWRSDSIRNIPKAITASLRRSSNWKIPWKSTGHIQSSFCTWKTAEGKKSGTRLKLWKQSKKTIVHVLKLSFKNPSVTSGKWFK